MFSPFLTFLSVFFVIFHYCFLLCVAFTFAFDVKVISPKQLDFIALKRYNIGVRQVSVC